MEERDAEVVVLLLNQYLGRMSEIILSYDGTIDEFVGDGILAVFGVPEKQLDDAARAVACALSMQNALQQVNDEMTAEGYPVLEMGIAVNTGSVIVGNIGSRARTKYGIVGTVVNRAARIESNTVGGDVLMGEETYRLVSDFVTTDPPRSVMMKGLKSPLVYYAVTAIGPPHDVDLVRRPVSEGGVEIHLPFHYWKVDNKRIVGDPLGGETSIFKENLITASISPPLEPMTDIKLIFDFCAEAHCFEDIYAKVMPVEEDNQKSVTHHLRITSIRQEDRDIINRWITEVSS